MEIYVELASLQFFDCGEALHTFMPLEEHVLLQNTALIVLEICNSRDFIPSGDELAEYHIV